MIRGARERRDAAAGASTRRVRVSPGAFAALVAGAALLGGVIHARIGGGLAGAARDVALAAALLLVAGAAAWTWWARERGRRHAAEERLAAAAIGERLRAERELKEATDRLVRQERLASLGVLAAGVAHEINNPLAFVISNVCMAEVMLGELAPDAPAQVGQAREALREAAEGAERVRRIVAELKTFSRPDEEAHGPVDLRRVLESALVMARSEIKHRARVELSFPPEPLAVDANSARLGQVFLNLLVNAAHAIPEGYADRNEIRIAGRADGGRVRVVVSDTGAGIPPEQLGRVFDPFFTTKPVGVGTGLGLAICHGIVSSLGGEIRAESTVGAGSTFTVILPAADPARLAAPPPEQPATAPREDAAPRRGRILVVDDEPGIGAAIRRVLRRDHDVVAATSGREALAAIQSESDFDAVLCDVMMPELTGMELYRVLRAEMPGLADRVVFMTGGTFTEEAEAFLAQVPDRHIAKPFDPGALRALVARLVAGRSPVIG